MTSLQWRGQLACIGLRVADVQRASAFYESVVGLAPHPASDDDTARLGWGLGSPVLELSAGSPGLEFFALEIPDPSELDGLLTRVQRSGIAVSQDSEGRHVLTDPDGRRVQLHGRIDRSGERTGDTGRRPLRLQHITFATSSLADVLDFYQGSLGMRLSDRMGDHFAWLRCGCEHHTVAVVKSDSPTLIDHFSFDLATWQDFRDWGDRLAVAGVDVAWGPGRHGPGNNLFIMFDDPDENHVELSAEMELYYDDRAEYEPRLWATETRTVNLWGQTPPWRAPQLVA